MSEFMSNIVYMICIYLKIIIVYNVKGWYQCNIIPLVNVMAVQPNCIYIQ